MATASIFILFLSAMAAVVAAVAAVASSSSSSSSAADRPASVRSEYGQVVTSSTLRWRPTSSSSLLPPHLDESVPFGTGDRANAVCRAEHHGAAAVMGHTVLVAGDGSAPRGLQCAVAFLGRVHRKHKFDLLVNPHSSARLEWRRYAKFGSVPEGAVAVGGGDDFVGRRRGRPTGGRRSGGDGGGDTQPGSIGLDQRTSAFGDMTVFIDASASSSSSSSPLLSSSSSSPVSESTSGEVLVEVEPERYELEIRDGSEDERAGRPKVTRSDVVLAKSSLFRFNEGRDREARLQKVLSYDYETSEYYGQLPGTIRALPSSVRLPGGRTTQLLWGLPERTRQRETLMVGHSLRHQSAVDVRVVGVRVTEEEPYAATLTAVYGDGDRRSRSVEGVVQRRYLDNIRPEYSRVYRIKDSVVVSAAKAKAAAEANVASEDGDEERDRRNREEVEERPYHGGGNGGGGDRGGKEASLVVQVDASSSSSSLMSMSVLQLLLLVATSVSSLLSL